MASAEANYESPSRISPETILSLWTEWTYVVQTQTQDLPRNGGDSHPVEWPRYTLLRDACARKDSCYVILHQAFCLWTLNKNDAYRMLNLSQAVTDSAFEALTSILKPTDSMAFKHVSWFSAFPSSSYDDRSAWLFRTEIDRVTDLVRNYSSNWLSLLADIEARCYPIMAWEAAVTLRCSSQLLAEILFTYTRRLLGCPDGLAASQLAVIFSKDLQNELKLNQLVPPGASHEVDVTRQDTAAQYYHLIAAATAQHAQHAHHGNAIGLSFCIGPTADYRTVPSQISSPITDQALQSSTAVTTHNMPVLGSNDRRHSSQSGTIPTPPNGVQRPMSSGSANSRAAPGIANQPNQPGPVRAAPRQNQNSARPSWPSMNIPSPLGTPHEPPTRSRQSPVSHSGANSPATSLSQQVIASLLRQPGSSETLPLNRQEHVTGHTQPRASEQVPATVTNEPPNTAQDVRKILEKGAQARIPPNLQANSPYDWTSVKNSLHLVGVRSPRRVPIEPTSARHYQTFSHFALKPQPIEPQTGIQTFTFDVSDADMKLLAPAIPGSTNLSTPTVGYFDGCYRYSFRICKRFVRETSIDECEWAIRPTCWPDIVHIQVNESIVQLKRKHHFHFDLPVELTDMLQAETNTILISLPESTKSNINDETFFVAVDVIKTLSHDNAVKMVWEAPPYLTDQTREEITRRLNASAQEDDLTALDNSLSISVADPFTSSVFSTPVRGVKCRHLACFDLENWLQSRQGKPSLVQEPNKAEPSKVDVWACPICDQDARPQSLRIDMLFVDIRRMLQEQGNLATKMIKVSKNGNWRPVKHDSERTYREPVKNHGTGISQPATSSSAAVIHIDDD